MEKNKVNIDVINLTMSETPKFVENKFRDWVLYGEDNCFPYKLQELANQSALHNAIISSKVDAVNGNGLQYDGDDDLKTNAFLTQANANETLDEVYAKCVYDLVLYGGYALEVIMSRDRKSIAEVYHIDFARIRSGKANDRGQVETYWYSKNWTKYRQAEFAPVPMPAYNKNSKEPSQLIYVKDYRPGVEYYPLPSYVGALSYIEIDGEIANFHLSHIKNGMSPSLMITFMGQPGDEERKAYKRQIRDAYTGSGNAGKFILNYAESADTAPVVTTLSPAQLDKQFLQLQTTVMDNILVGHKVTSPLLVGIKTPGQLGGTQELETAFELYNNQVISPMKEMLLKTFNKIMEFNGLKELFVETVAPITFTYSENVLTQILTKDEMRENIGYASLQETITPNITQTNESASIQK